MTKFQVGQVVWVKPLARKGVVQGGGHYATRVGGAIWENKYLATIDQQQRYLIRESLQRRYINQERARRRLAILLSEPPECAFKSRADYRRGYVDWAYSLGGPEDMPLGVRERYFRFLMTPEGA